MASTGNEVMLVTVDMCDLRDLVNAAAEHYKGKGAIMRDMLRYQEDPSNPIVKLRNQYMAAIELHQAQPVGGVQ